MQLQAFPVSSDPLPLLSINFNSPCHLFSPSLFLQWCILFDTHNQYDWLRVCVCLYVRVCASGICEFYQSELYSLTSLSLWQTSSNYLLWKLTFTESVTANCYLNGGVLYFLCYHCGSISLYIYDMLVWLFHLGMWGVRQVGPFYSFSYISCICIWTFSEVVFCVCVCVWCCYTMLHYLYLYTLGYCTCIL